MQEIRNLKEDIQQNVMYEVHKVRNEFRTEIDSVYERLHAFECINAAKVRSIFQSLNALEYSDADRSVESTAPAPLADSVNSVTIGTMSITNTPNAVSSMHANAEDSRSFGRASNRDIFMEGMSAVCLLDSDSPVSVAEAGYVRGLLEAKGVDINAWPVDAVSTANSVANGHSLDLVGSTLLQVSFGGEAKPVRFQLTAEELPAPVILGENAFRDLGIRILEPQSGSSHQEATGPRPHSSAVEVTQQRLGRNQVKLLRSHMRGASRNKQNS